MKRLLTVAAALALAITGLIAAPATGSTVSATCDNNYPSYVTEQTLVNTVVYVGTQRQVATSPATFSLAVCYSDTELARPSTLIGGYVKVTVVNRAPTAPNQWDVNIECRGDSPTMLASVNCDGDGSTTTTTTTSSNPPSAGASVSGWTLVNGSTLTLGTTGANTGTVSTTSTNPEATYGGTCATVAGVTPPIVTQCAGNAIDAQIARGDVGTVVSPTSDTCLVTTGSSCLVWKPRAGIVLFGDTANDTYVQLLHIPVVTDPDSGQCYGLC